METAVRENPTHGATVPRNRAHGAVRTDKSRSIKRAAKQEKVQPKEMCFFLTSTFIELPSTNLAVAGPDYFRVADHSSRIGDSLRTETF
jgi:hypothetical protein